MVIKMKHTHLSIQYSMLNSLFFRIHGDDDGIEDVRCLSKHSFMINSVGTIIYSMPYFNQVYFHNLNVIVSWYHQISMISVLAKV